MSALSTRVNVYFLLLLSPDMWIILTPLPRMRKKKLFPPSLYPSLISSPLPLNKKEEKLFGCWIRRTGGCSGQCLQGSFSFRIATFRRFIFQSIPSPVINAYNCLVVPVDKSVSFRWKIRSSPRGQRFCSPCNSYVLSLNGFQIWERNKNAIFWLPKPQHLWKVLSTFWHTLETL